MTFDTKAARQMSARNVPTIDPYSHPATALSLACDEVERLNHEVDVARNLAALAKDLVDDQAKRIAELEAGMKSGFVGYQYRIIAKQRAALKKLGQAKRERGKALVEERADIIAYGNGYRLADFEISKSRERLLNEAREELRQEKLL